MGYSINGVPVPPGMSLPEFFAKAKQGQMDYTTGLLASPLMQNPDFLDDRLNLFTNMLNYNPENIGGLDSGPFDALDAVNYATHGAQMGNEATLADIASQRYDFPVSNAADMAYGGYGLPLWLALQKGLIK